MNAPEGVVFAERRTRRATTAAEDTLHDMGAVSTIASYRRTMRRVGEVQIRIWQTATENRRATSALILNDATPAIKLNPQTREISANGELSSRQPAEALPMEQHYFP